MFPVAPFHTKQLGKGHLVLLTYGSRMVQVLFVCLRHVQVRSLEIQKEGGGVSKVKFVKKSMNLNWNF